MQQDENLTTGMQAEELELAPETGEENASFLDVPVEETSTESVSLEGAPPKETSDEEPAPKGKTRKSIWPSGKKDRISFIAYAALLLACLVFLGVSGIFRGIGETFLLMGNAHEEIGSFIEALRNGDGDLFGGAMGGIGGAFEGGGGEERDPEKIYDTNVLFRTAFDEYQEDLSVSHLNLTSDELRAEVERFLFTNPYYFYVSTSYSVVYRQDTNVVTTVRFTYLYDKATTAEKTAQLEAIVQEIVDASPNGTQFDEVLYFHDYLVKHYTYDRRTPSDGKEIRDVYGFFTEGKGVCQAYMQAMVLLCSARAIEAIPVVSKDMNHAWNLVRIDGNWYHVDVTWDACNYQDGGNAYHYFLLSDEAITAKTREGDLNWEQHKNFNTWEKASDKAFDNAAWRDANTQMLYTENGYYFHVGNVLYRYVEGEGETLLDDLSDALAGWRVYGIRACVEDQLYLTVAPDSHSVPETFIYTISE